MGILDTLDQNEKKLLKKRFFRKNEILYHEGDICTSISIVVIGDIDITSYSFKGKDIVYNSLSSGDMFGNNLLFSSNPKYRGDVVTKSAGQIYVIEQPTLLYFLKNNNAFLLEYLKVCSDFGKSLNSKIKLLSFNHAEERLKYLFVINDGVIRFKYITTLADTLNLSREATSRLISKLIKEGKIKRTMNVLTLV